MSGLASPSAPPPRPRAPARPGAILLRTALVAALVAGLHLGLLQLLAGSDVVARLFSAGGHSAWGSLVLALLFVLARLAAIVALPGFVLYRLVKLLLSLVDASAARRAGGPGSAAAPAAGPSGDPPGPAGSSRS